MTVAQGPPRRSTLVLTALLHLPVLFLYLVSGLAAPGWAVLVLLALWVLLGWVAYRVHRRWGALSALVPLLALVLWFGLMTAGDRLLGWTA
ncbi:MAG: hypothetical protein M3P31_00635 [Actinomycetota bacterium]|nr:hypothetical protein [Actinomycetota bacterium]